MICAEWPRAIATPPHRQDPAGFARHRTRVAFLCLRVLEYRLAVSTYIGSGFELGHIGRATFLTFDGFDGHWASFEWPHRVDRKWSMSVADRVDEDVRS